MNVLLVAFVLLAIVTLIGHGLWVISANILGAVLGDDSRADDTATSFCSLCHAPKPHDAIVCPACHAAAATPQRKANIGSITILAQIDRFYKQGILDKATYDRMAQAIANECTCEPNLSALVAYESKQRTAEDQTAPPTIAAAEQESAMADPKAEPMLAEIAGTAPDGLVEHSPPAAQDIATAGFEAGSPTTQERRRAAAARLGMHGPREFELEPPQRRAAVSTLLASFMEEHSIRWGEVVGGLLIIGCSIALVISFWSEIASRPLLKFIIFNSVTAGLFGIGVYVDRRWQLKTTSIGILIISILLVPLNVLAIAAFTDASPPSDFLSIAGEVFSLTIFASLTFVAARTVVPNNRLAVTIGVMVPSVLQLLTRRFVRVDSGYLSLYCLALAPVVCYWATSISGLRWLSKEEEAEEHSLNEFFIVLGLVTYSALLPLALFLYKIWNAPQVIDDMSPVLSLFALPSIAVGVFSWRRLVQPVAAKARVAGVAIGCLGAILLGAAIFQAWPHPAVLLPTTFIPGVLFLALAVAWKLPMAYYGVSLSSLIAWPMAAHVLRGAIGWRSSTTELTSAMASAPTGNLLLPLVGVIAGAAVLLARRNQHDEARVAGISAAIITAVSLALVSWFGFGQVGDPHGVTFTFAAISIVAYVAAIRIHHVGLTWTAALMVLVALIQAVLFRWPDGGPFLVRCATAGLLHASICATASLFLTLPQRPHHRVLVASCQAAMVTSSIAISLVILAWMDGGNVVVLPYAIWTSIVWFVVAMLSNEPSTFAAFQTAAGVTLLCVAVRVTRAEQWDSSSTMSWIQPLFVQHLAILLAIYSVVASGLRWWLPPNVDGSPAAPPAGFESKATSATNDSEILQTGWSRKKLVRRLGGLVHAGPSRVDHAVAGFVVVLTTCLTLYAAVPGAAQELASTNHFVGSVTRVVPPITNFEIPSVRSTAAANFVSWVVLTSAIIVVIVRSRQWLPGLSKLLLLFLLALACPLISAHWLPDVSVASALRWTIAIFFLLSSVPLWFRHRVPPLLSRFVVTQSSRAATALQVFGLSEADAAQSMLFAIVLVPYALMGLYVGASSLSITGLPASVVNAMPGLMMVATVSLVVFGLAWRAGSNAATSEQDRLHPSWTSHAGAVALVMGVGPLFVAILFAVAAALMKYPIVGPNPDSWFRAVGLPIAYATPVFLIAITLVGHAIRERSPSLAFGSGILFQIAATAGFMLAIPTMGRKLDALTWSHVALINTIAAGLVSIVWLGYITRTGRRKRRSQTIPILLTSYIVMGGSLLAATLLPALAHLWLNPPAASTIGWIGSVGSLPGWFALSCVSVAVWWWRIRSSMRGTENDAQSGTSSMVFESGAAMLSIVILVASTLARWDTGNWLAFHTFESGISVALGLVVTGWWNGRGRPVGAGDTEMHGDVWYVPFAVIAVLFALRGSFDDAQGHWWSVGTITWVALTSAILAWNTRQRRLVFVAGALWTVGGSLWWVLVPLPNHSGGVAEILFEFLHFNQILAIAPILFSLMFESLRKPTRDRRKTVVSYHGAMAILGTLMFFLTVSLGLFADLYESPINNHSLLSFGAWSVLMVSAIGWYVERRGSVSGPNVYLIGLLGLAFFQDRLDTSGAFFWWTTTILLAAYGLGTSYLWSQRSKASELFTRLASTLFRGTDFAANSGAALVKPKEESRRALGWFVTANGILAATVVVLVAWIDLTFETMAMRIPASHAVIAQAFSLALLAKGTTRTPLQYASLSLGSIFAVVFGWSWLQPHMPATVLHHAAVVVVALATATIVYGFGFVKLLDRRNDWVTAAERLVPSLIGIGSAALLFIGGCELVHYFRDGQVPIQPAAIVSVAVALLAICGACFAAAILPGRDPLGLSDRGKQAYVYAAEFTLVMLGMHVRLTMPWLFHGWFTRFWPLIAMGIAFVGVGLGELMQRRRQRVLSEPLVTTGALLPALPVLSFWIAPTEVNYSLTLLSVGALYATLSVLRKSFLYSVLAAIAANGSLWYFLHQVDGLDFLRHPQLWLIPPALCVLVASHLCRRQLTDVQATSMRYAAALVIYVASTADIFITGVANAPWLPIVLAGISLAGIFAGILLRVRAFLYLGVSFLLVSLLTVIWYAAVELERTWIWWVAGIVTGMLIIALFAVFEKRREETLELVENLKSWER